MAINFPSSPLVGDLYTFNGKTWQWDGSYWIFVSSTNMLSSATTVGGGVSIISGISNSVLYLKSLTGGVTDNGNTISISGGTSSGTTSSSFTGGTISGATNFTNGLSANTFSAQTITTTGLTGSVALISQRNSIPTSLRYWGMLCEVYADTNPDNNGTYKLTYNYVNTTLSDNNNWALSLDAYSLTLCF